MSGRVRVTNLETFKKVASNVHNNKYSYDNSIYVNSHTPLKIICPDHGEFEQTPNDHLCGKGCKYCYYDKTRERMSSNLDEFIKKSKLKWGNDTFDYSLSVYTSNEDNIILICNKHKKEFSQRVSNHLTGEVGCPECKGKTYGYREFY